MNKVWISIAAVIVILISGVFIVMNRPDSSKQRISDQTPDNVGVNSNETMMQAGSIRTLLANGSNQMCTFTDTETGSNGTVYVSNGSMYGDITSLVDGSSTVSHMILDGGTYMYIWMDNQPGGFKASLEQFANTSPNSPNTQAVDIDKQMDYQCNPWSVDTSLFAVPADREFTDMGAMMEGAGKTLEKTDSEATQCDVCDSLTGDTKTRCLQALSCN